jgi:hypothetical protein
VYAPDHSTYQCACSVGAGGLLDDDDVYVGRCVTYGENV